MNRVTLVGLLAVLYAFSSLFYFAGLTPLRIAVLSPLAGAAVYIVIELRIAENTP